MKKIMWAAVALTLFAMTSRAQNTPKADVGVGYDFLHITSGGGLNMNGFGASVAYNVTDMIGIVGDFGYYHGSVTVLGTSTGVNAESYTFGPRFSIRKYDKATPFVQALFGGSHASASLFGSTASLNPFAFAFGGGVDFPLKGDKVGLRPEFDYVGLRSNGTTTNSVRIGVGLVFHIGQK